jgi:hypothetical protein
LSTLARVSLSRSPHLKEVVPVQRIVRLVLVVSIALIALPAAAVDAAPRMTIGFYDDNSFRWDPAAAKNLLAAQRTGASIIHVTADWSQIAPTKPASPLNGDDHAYKIHDLDVLIAQAGRYDQEVMINISGAPKWANGGKPPNVPPRNLNTITQFARMLAKRYDGTTSRGLVSRWSVWNEPNLGLFLTPQFSGTQIVSPRTYVKVYLAAYHGIKAGNRHALVAVGETSNRGRDKPLSGAPDSVAPATFARLVAQVAPNLPFDAWATHPYPTDPFLGPTQKVKWPNVTLTRITQFGDSLRTWFHRRVPIWITEYGEQTKPEFAAGVTHARQASDAKLALKLAAASPYVDMFVWFTIKDSPGTWQSGLFTRNGKKKPAYAAFASTALKLAGQTQTIAPGRSPTVKVFVPFIAYHGRPGSFVGVTYRVFAGSKLVAVHQARARTAGDASVSFVAKFKPAKGKQYTLTATVGDKNGQLDKRTVALVPPASSHG